MLFKRVIVLLAACMALGVLVFLLRATRGTELDLDRHNARVAQMREMARLDVELDDAVRRSRLSLDAKATDLDAAEQAVLEAGRKLSGKDMGLLGFNTRVDAAFTSYATTVRGKLAAVRHYATQQSAFVAAYQDFRKLGERALGEALPSQQTSLRQSVATLVSDLTTYSLQAAPGNGEAINAQIEALSRSAAASEPRVQTALQQLALAAQRVRGAKDSMRSAAEPIANAGTAAALTALATTYADEHQTRLAAPERYRMILVVYAGSLLLAFGMIGLRMRRSFGDLDRANAELQSANTNLESLVESRTIDLRKALEDVRLQQAQLIQSEKMASLGQMVAGVAHEINTPLGYARSNVGIVRELIATLRGSEGASEESVEESDVLLADAEHGLHQIAELVMGLKNFSRVDRSRQEWFNVNEGIDSALKICQNQLKGRVQIERDFGELPPIPCAPSQLNQVFLNILTNAGQAIDGDGTINIQTRSTAEQVRIVIRDSGCGMDEQTQAHIFEPFFTTKDVGHGTGLGLSIVFRIIEDHRGSIEVDSAPGRGTAFIITLPAVAASAAVRDTHAVTAPADAVFA